MAILHSCCLWRSVRRGSFASVIYTLIYFSISCITMSLFLHEERRYLRGEVDKPIGESFLERDTISGVTVKFNVLLLVFATLGVFSSVLVLIGLKMNNRGLLLPWIGVMIADLLVECAHFVYLIAIETLKFEPLTAMLFTIDFFIMCLNIYCLLCVISQYQEYKAGRGQADDDSYTCPSNIQYSPPAPTCLPQAKTTTLSPVICPHSNCTLIPEETQINGTFVGSVASSPLRALPTVRPPRSSLLKKHVKFSAGDKPKGCCTGIIHPENIIKDGTKPNGHMMVSIEALPEYSEDKLSWHEQKLTNVNQLYPSIKGSTMHENQHHQAEH
ncbi:uncharacterized protein LOC128300366 [Anopheles moucheti]|uniref:uncharacterized protein LOC128300366 n=1 Tax=Anopheles moucheti TaxID=186751 RepID=UPI0022F054F4|nr:uncharacterized protein LOC128300366 [Anopheles moucheti]